jgi:hypothetical protein
MTERTFYSGAGVTVTNSRFIVPGQMYTMHGVTSIRSTVTPPSRTGPIILAVVGFLFLLAGDSAMVMGLLLIGGAIFWWMQQKPEYAVVLSSASGEARALTSTDKSFISQVVSALHEAIVSRG